MSSNVNPQPDLSSCKSGDIFLKIAKNDDELTKAKKLRYYIFFEEPQGIKEPSGKIDEDEFDEDCEHFLVINSANGQEEVVGTYRLLRRDQNNKPKKFYTSTEYDISKLTQSNYNLLELGRSCIHPDFRDGKVIQLLWKGIGIYIAYYNINYMFGCASFPSVNPNDYADSIAYLMNNYKAPEEICPVALDSVRADIDFSKVVIEDKKAAFSKMPALLKGYIRTGCMVGEGAVIDNFCKTTDVCIIMDTSRISKRYSDHFVKSN